MSNQLKSKDPSSEDSIPLVNTESSKLLRSQYAKLVFKKTWDELSELQQFIILNSWVESHPELLEPSEVYAIHAGTNIEKFSKTLINRKRKNTKSWVFMTVNPKPGTDLQLLRNALEKRFEKSPHVGDHMYCYETRKDFRIEDPGLHVHILFHKHEPPSKAIPPVESIFKSFVATPLHINTHIIADKDLSNIKNYIRGFKKGGLKKNHTNDVEYREFHSLSAVKGTMR